MTDYNTRQRRLNVIVGGFVIIAFAAFCWMLFKFREMPSLVRGFKSYQVLVYFTSAAGVDKNTPVRYCGYEIGRVIGVAPPLRIDEPQPGQPLHRVPVTLAIERKYINIPDTVQVKLMKRGLGSSYIELVYDPDIPFTDFLQEHATLEGSVAMASEFLPEEVQKKIESLVDSINALAINANEVIGDNENQTNIKMTLANITAATKQAAITLKSIQNFSDSGSEAILTSAEQLNSVLKQFNKVLAKLNEGDGSTAKLLNDGRLYENLIDSSQELQMALDQLKQLAAEAREKGIKIKW